MVGNREEASTDFQLLQVAVGGLKIPESGLPFHVVVLLLLLDRLFQMLISLNLLGGVLWDFVMICDYTSPDCFLRQLSLFLFRSWTLVNFFEG